MSATIKSLGSRRSDAERNTERIIQAAVSQLRLRPDATVASIARKAGLSRATVYGHFSSRHSLIDAAIARVLDENRDVLDDAADDPNPVHALERVIGLSFQLMDFSRSVALAATDALTSTRLRALHTAHAERVATLIRRGQSEGIFRDDLPVWWLITSIHQIFHGSASDLSAQRVLPTQAQALLIGTVLALLRRPETCPRRATR
ncbi:TetR/AcrR family transcriptional regulator [Micrococcus luteus KDCGSN]|uniref:TetR/AcrR family transcriptional regulator n=1 Tax=Micrococcus luteus TaxID=1270 RepID=UPI0033F132B4